MRPLITLAMLMCIAFAANAQKFTPGYYIKSSGDTVKDDLSIQKKKQAIDKVVTPEGLFMGPKDLLGFGLDGINYVVESVSVDKSPQLGVVRDTVFLEVMARGKMSLYTMIDENEKAHFYIENENGIHELSVKLVNYDGQVQTQRIETYKGTLKGLFPACTNIFPAIEKTSLSKKAMLSIFKKLYQCRFDEDALVQKAHDEPPTNFGLIAGVTITDVKFNPIGKTASPNAGHAAVLPFVTFKDQSIAPTGGIYFEKSFSRSRAFAARHEITYMEYSNKSEEYRLDDFTSNGYYATVSAKYVKYNFIVRTYFLHGSVRPFVNLGVSGKYALSTQAYLERSNVPNADKMPLFQKLPKAQAAGFIGGGVMYSNFALDFRYELSRGLNHTVVGSKVTTLYFTLSYQIKGEKKKNEKPRH